MPGEYKQPISCIQKEFCSEKVLHYVAPYVIYLWNSECKILDIYNTENVMCITLINGQYQKYNRLIDIYKAGRLPSLLFVITTCCDKKTFTYQNELVTELNLLAHHIANGDSVAISNPTYINEEHPLYASTYHMNYFVDNALNLEVIEWYKSWRAQKGVKRS
jgi:hypothetical protein